MSKLQNKKIAFLATCGVEQIELTRPWQDIKNAGANVQLISIKEGQIQGFNHFDKADKFQVDATVEQVSAQDFDGLVIPGGLHNPDSLRADEQAVQFVRDFFEQHKPVAAICHGPWLLVEADVLEGRTVTSFKSIKTDLQNAGANWVDEKVVVDQGLITSRNPDDLDAFCKKCIEEFCEGKHEGQIAA